MTKYLKREETAALDAINAYVRTLKNLQANCEHLILLEYHGSNGAKPVHSRICEDCGLSERVEAWSPRFSVLPGRAYIVKWEEFDSARPIWSELK